VKALRLAAVEWVGSLVDSRYERAREGYQVHLFSLFLSFAAREATLKIRLPLPIACKWGYEIDWVVKLWGPCSSSGSIIPCRHEAAAVCRAFLLQRVPIYHWLGTSGSLEDSRVLSKCLSSQSRLRSSQRAPAYEEHLIREHDNT
jgi:hypothetical protein